MMEQAASLEEPQVLFDLPKLFSPSGKILTGPSYQIASSRKRKRRDIAIAVDGQGLNLYGMKTSRPTASYAIPPQSTFTAPPVFLHKRGNPGKTTAERFGCAAVRNGLGATSHQLVCFAESVSEGPQQTLDASLTVKKHTTDLQSTDADEVIFIDAISAPRKQNDSSPPFQLVTVSKAGRVRCLSGDLDIELWTGDLSEGVHPARGVMRQQNVLQFACMDNLDSMCKGFLSSHPDLLAQVNPADEDDLKRLRGTQGLVSISASSDGPAHPWRYLVSVHILRQSSAGVRSALQHLMTWTLPLENVEKLEDIHSFSFDVRSGHIHANLGKELHVFNISRTVATKIGSIGAHDDSFNSTVHLKGPLVAACVQRHLSIYDLSHNSILTRRETFRPNRSLKRKRQDNSALSGPFQVIRYDSSADLLFGITDAQLVSIKLELRQGPRLADHTKVGRLADSLGRAALSNTITSAGSSGDDAFRSMSEKIIARLSAAANDMEAFDQAFNTNVIEDESLPVQVSRRVSAFTICRIFAYVGQESKKKLDSQPSLRVARMPEDSFKWLTVKGYVTPANIEHTLCQNTRSGATLPLVTAHDLVEAIARFDQSLVLLSTWIDLQPHPELDTFVQALRRLLESFDTDEPSVEAKLLTDYKHEEGHSEDEMLADAERAAERDLEAADRLLEDGMRIRALAIKTCLSRLGASFQQGSLSHSFKTNMSQRDLVLLIDLIRVELSEDGWMTRQLEQSITAENCDVSSDGLQASCLLLNAAVDALGSGGLLASSYGIAPDDHETAEQFLSTLRYETAALLESVQESTFFAGFLRDFLRFQTALDSSRTMQFKQANTKLDKLGLQKGTLTSQLPLGLKSVKAVSATKVGAGGGIQRRSAREIGHKLNQRVGQYAFETIRI